MSTKQALNTEQVLIEMIKNPGKKFTNGLVVAYYENVRICLEMSGYWSLYRFLKAFGSDTWTELKEPRVVEIESEIAFNEYAQVLGSLYEELRESLGGMLFAGKTFNLKITATEVL